MTAPQAPHLGTGGPGEPRLVGRDLLLAELESVASSARGGSGSLVLLTGEAGVGKTSVVRAVATSMRGAFEVSWGLCPPDRSAPPFWPWREVVSDPVREREVDDRTTTAIGAARFERLMAMRDTVIERARRGPLLHVIEDLQWADVASAMLLVHLGASVVDAPLMIVATLRTGEPLGAELSGALEEVRRSSHVLAVTPLAVGDVGVLMRRRGLAPDAELAAIVWERTGGNALFATELLRSIDATAAGTRVRDIAAGDVPTRVSELVAHRLARLPDAVAELVRTASVVGAEGEARTLAEVCDSTVAAVVDLAEQARAAHLFDATGPGRWRFRHELVRDAVAASMTQRVRAARHAVVLEALAADPATPPAVLARHALAAQPLFDAERAVALAAAAGQAAFEHHAYEEAVSWFEGALGAASSGVVPRWRGELLVSCGEAHRHLGHVAEARAAFVAAADLVDDPTLLARAALGYADQGADLGIAYRQDDATTTRLLGRAIDAQAGADTVTTVLLESRLAAELYFSDAPERAQGLAAAALARATRLGDRRALVAAGALHHDAFVVGRAPLAEQLAGSQRLLDWALDAATPGALLTAHRARAIDLLAAGDLSGVDREVLAFRRIAEPLRVPGYAWWPAMWSAGRALLDGRHDVAERRAVEAYELGEGSFASLAFVNLSFLLFFLRREQGRSAELEQAARDSAASHADIPAIRVALAMLLAELDRDGEAAALVRSLATDDLDRLRDRNWPASWFQLARAARLVGDATTAATLLDERIRPTERVVTVSLATVCLGAADLATAWLLHVVGDLDAADDRYRRAAAIDAEIGARAWLAQTQVDHAALLLDRGGAGDHDAARELALAATGIADDIGLVAVAPTLARVRDRLGAPRAASPATPVVDEPARFRRDGDVWEIEFAGRSVRLAHARGLADLALLLARPGEAVSVLQLVGQAGVEVVEGRGALALDDRARREIRDRLHELDAAVDAAEAAGDGERAALAREQRQVLAEVVVGDLGLRGRSRVIGDPVERARKTVSTRIRRAIALVARAHPELGRHLERSVDTGTWCAYRPAERTTWQT